ncbi:centrosomal protein of 135 kDa [Acyrthosiphon pisum]|uniref:Centrosomal protein of 135 kDa n=1 Tax=Acyrthosiphon pisum TaxID=7029 RepID=A0A8R1VZQ0_ACYPI|nr:centrosomal protein of 135 kDa [Acyrthosiphon pisum]|eukprot:XP_001945549.2 PREDICTED: centrosomal protein of 135 kDa [Acyrthosiphon pisum]
MNQPEQNERFESIRYQLDALGYRQYMPPDSIGLVSQLIGDLLHTTNSLKQYKNLAQNTLEVARNLEAKSAPYLRDNCSLIQEHNELQSKLKKELEYVKILENKIGILESEIKEWKQENEKLSKKVEHLEDEAIIKNAKLLELGNLFLIPQVENKSKEFKSLRPLIQIDHSDNNKNGDENKEIIHKENDILKKKVKELYRETVHLKKNIKHTKCQSNKTSPKQQSQMIKNDAESDTFIDMRADNEVLRRQLDEVLANHSEAMFHLTRVTEEKKSLQRSLNEYIKNHCNCDKDMSVLLENNTCLLELKTKNQSLESEICEYENKLKKALDDQKQLLEKINFSKNIETELMSEIEKISEEKHLQSQKISQLEQNIQKSKTEKNDKTKSWQENKCSCSKVSVDELKRTFDAERRDYERKLEKIMKSQLDPLRHEKRSNDLEIAVSKLRAERDEYLYEINCLKKQHNAEILDFKRKIEEMKREVYERSDRQNILKLKRDKDEFAEEIIGLKKEIEFLNSQLKKTRESVKNNEYNEREYIKQLEDEKHQLIEKQRSLTWESANKQRESEKYHREISHLKAELKRLTAMMDDQKCCQDRLERTLQSTQFAQNATEEQLERAQVRIEELKLINNKLNDQLIDEQQERHKSHNNTMAIDHQRDTLTNELEKKTKRIIHLDSLVTDKEKQIQSLHSKLTDAAKKIGNALSSQSETEKMCDSLKLELSNIKAEYKLIESNSGSQQKEKKRLQNDLDMVVQDNKVLRAELEASKKQAEDLKMQLQVYVLEIRRVEEILEVKESERDEILEQFKTLNCEATQLESNNYSLESEAKSTKTLLREKEHRMSDLERKLVDKEDLISSYESQISNLTHQIVSLESQLSSGNDRISKLEQDLHACREICSSVDSAKFNLNERLGHVENLQHKAEEERLRLADELTVVNTQLERERSKITTIEAVLSDSRQECMKLTITKNDLKERLEDSEKKSKNLEEYLERTKNELVMCRSTITSFEKEISSLKRQLNDVKFEKAKLEQARREYHSTTL